MVGYQTRKIIDKSERGGGKKHIEQQQRAVRMRLKSRTKINNINIYNNIYMCVYAVYDAQTTRFYIKTIHIIYMCYRAVSVSEWLYNIGWSATVWRFLCTADKLFFSPKAKISTQRMKNVKPRNEKKYGSIKIFCQMQFAPHKYLCALILLYIGAAVNYFFLSRHRSAGNPPNYLHESIYT